jgi:hypothetical protein
LASAALAEKLFCARARATARLGRFNRRAQLRDDLSALHELPRSAPT